jgi:hypothetical protein
MRILLVLLLLVVTGSTFAEDVRFTLTWPVNRGKLGHMVFEAEVSDVEFQMTSRQNYRLDIGGRIELHNGAWHVNKISKSSNVNINFEKLANGRRHKKLAQEQWLRGRMARHLLHKEKAVGSIPIAATKLNGKWVITRHRYQDKLWSP